MYVDPQPIFTQNGLWLKNVHHAVIKSKLFYTSDPRPRKLGKFGKFSDFSPMLKFLAINSL